MLRAAATLLALAVTSALGIAQIKSQQLHRAESLVDGLLQFPAPTPQNVPEGLCFSKTSKCLSGWELYFFIILSSDAHFTHDTPRHYVLDLPFARWP
jgi:hypothetical protein